MTLQGRFNTIDELNTYYVQIGQGNPIINIDDVLENVSILDDEIVCFSDDPIEITSDLSDTFNNVFIRNATINLETNFDLMDGLVARNYIDIPVQILNGQNTVIFSGYLEPLSFNSPFAHVWNNLSLNCVDKLGILQYIKYGDLIDLEDIEYSTPRSIINLILSNCEFSSIEFNITNDFTNQTKINPMIFLGESPDDWMSCEEVLNELGKIYGFWIWQDGDICRIENIMDYSQGTTVSVIKDNYKSDDMNITAEQAYSKIKLTCDIEGGESTLLDPFDDNNLVPMYEKSHVYMQEMAFPGEGSTAFKAFKSYLSGNIPTYNVQCVNNHYVRAKKNKLFDFGDDGYVDNISNNVDLMYFLNEHAGKGAFVSLGKTENMMNPKDTKTVVDANMTDYLMISIKGQDRNINDTTMDTQIQNNVPICTCNLANVTNLVPIDGYTKNYIVFSGKILLNPLQEKTGSNWKGHSTYTNHYYRTTNIFGTTKYQMLNEEWPYLSNWHHTVPHPQNGDGAYYQQRFVDRNTPLIFDTITGTYKPNWNDNAVATFGYLNNEKNKLFQYLYNEFGREIDTLDKIPLLCCKLKIGNKYCVERLDLGDAGLNKFQWVTEEQFHVVDGVTIDFFTLGINPKIDDYIIGESFEFNDTTQGLNIGEKGTAIPINFSDRLMGRMEFSILGPWNATFKDGKYKALLSFISVHIEAAAHRILEKLENILISDFKMKLASDNAKTDLKNSNDLVYYSESNSIYNEVMEYDTKFCTALTNEEANRLGIDFTLNNSVILTLYNEPFYGFDYVDEGEFLHNVKLEELRVSEQYKIWGNTKKVLNLTLDLENPEFANFKRNYRFNYLDGLYHCIGRDINLKNSTMTLTLKKI